MTGQVLATWLVYGCCYSIEKAFATVYSMNRNPYEARDNNWLMELLNYARNLRGDHLSK
jgi:hypothetical protein